MAGPDPAVARARRAMALAGHPDVSWSILLEARLAGADDPDGLGLGGAAVTDRVRSVLAGRPDLGPPPAVRTPTGPAGPAGPGGPAGLADVRRAFADDPYRDGEAALRVAIWPDVVLVAAHHGALDGLGLLALLGVVLGSPAESSATGLGTKPPARSFASAAALRVAEAVVAPPARIAPRGGRSSAPGDELASRDAPALAAGTAALVAATARATERWNRARGRNARRTVIAVGASRRAGSNLELQERSAFLRIRTGQRPDGSRARALLAAASPEPSSPSSARPGPAAWLARILAGRLGSTALVSNLGVVRGPPALHSVAFHPVAHGRSGVALGAATVAEITTLTIRARRRDFDRGAAEAFLEVVARELGASPVGSSEGTTAGTSTDP